MCLHGHAIAASMCMEEEKKKQAMFSCVYLYAMSPSPYKMCVLCIMCAVEQSPPDNKVLCTHEAQEGLHEKEKYKEVTQLLPHS